MDVFTFFCHEELKVTYKRLKQYFYDHNDNNNDNINNDDNFISVSNGFSTGGRQALIKDTLTAITILLI